MANRFVLNEMSYHGHGAIENIAPEAKAARFLGFSTRKFRIKK